jgi:hypothetical protein
METSSGYSSYTNLIFIKYNNREDVLSIKTKLRVCYQFYKYLNQEQINDRKYIQQVY